ncbi:MAG: class I SAM-dependent RNA methyltransferase [Lachnospiraceae bacterium]|nr:class I SAM-dependent RNA methyltransferase [Lachnospiraceae bacterium]
MQLYEYIAPCHFGLESVLKREITNLGYDVIKTEDGRVTFAGDAEAAAYANVFIRTAERILLKVGEFRAETFDELFENTKKLAWEEIIPKNGRFWVTKANSVKSRLFSPSDIQSIMKKAMVERMKEHYHIERFPEDGEDYPVRVSILKDIVTVGLDTTGVSLHKRGYRKATVKAPITETLAAALILLTPWKKNRILVDPFCGSGTFVIEAAMMAANMAPGMNRSFTADRWGIIPHSCWKNAVEEAQENVDRNVTTDIQGFDADPAVIKMARENAALAGVEDLIHLQTRDISGLSHHGKFGFIITNPPYGERIGETEELPGIYAELGRRFSALDSWSLYMITSYEDAQKYIGRPADKNRKIYNGMLKTYFYQYIGPRPPRGAAF